MKGGPNFSRVKSVGLGGLEGVGTTQDDLPVRTSAAVHSCF